MLRALLLTLLLAPATGLFACSCLYVDNFCDYLESYLQWDTTDSRVLVAEVTLLRQHDPLTGFPLYDFRIDEVLLGEYAEEQVSLLGQDGANCNGPREALAPGRRLVLFFYKGGYFSAYGHQDYQGPYPVYDFPGCGVAYLDVDDNSVSGIITGTAERMTKERFREQLAGCGGEGLVQPTQTNPAPTFPAVTVNVYPNPTAGPLTVVVESDSRVEGVDVMDIRGRKIVENAVSVASDELSPLPQTYTFDLSGLAGGVYYATVRTSGRTVRRKVVVY